MGETRTTRLMGMEVPAGSDPASVYRRIQMMEQLTERSMTIPGIGYPIGMDAVIGLIPVVNGHNRLLHDGRARSIEEAILWHGGEAEKAKENFKQLTKNERESLIFFLESI